MVIAEANRKTPFLATTLLMKRHGFFVFYSLPNFFFSIKSFSFPCCVGTCMWLAVLKTLNCNSLLIPSWPIFAGEITASLFVLVQYYLFNCSVLHCGNLFYLIELSISFFYGVVCFLKYIHCSVSFSYFFSSRISIQFFSRYVMLFSAVLRADIFKLVFQFLLT